MTRILLAALTLAALPLGSRAEEPIVRLNVRPMRAPVPALQYQLLPEVREMNPGNPAQWYVRCFQEQRNFFFSKEAVAERARYQSMPLAELPVDKLRDYGRNALNQADWAARLDALDWQVLQRVQTDGTDVMLSELRPLRVLGAALQVRFRGRVAGRQYDDAIVTAKTMFALARHLGEHPTVAANRLGLDIALLALDTLAEMVQQPGCPNLYWALTDLPCPLVDLRKGLQGECAQVAAELRLLRDDAAMTPAQVEEAVGRLSGAMGFAREQTGQSPRGIRVKLKERIQDFDRVVAARARLIAAGCALSLVGQFPPEQVILLDEKRAYEVRRDERLKLLALAPGQSDTLAAGDGDGLFADLLPPVREVRCRQGQLEQRIALLRHVEALRLYAAEHNDEFPSRLADVGVPLPADPFTGQPFAYAVDGAIARLGRNVRYEVAIQKGWSLPRW